MLLTELEGPAVPEEKAHSAGCCLGALSSAARGAQGLDLFFCSDCHPSALSLRESFLATLY